MSVKRLFVVSAVLEVGAGVAIAVAPSLAVSMLLGTVFDSQADLTVGRLTGAALLTLGVACWLARDDEDSRAAHGLVAAMTIYNIGAVVVLAIAGASSGTKAPVLWGVVLLHLAMAVWCIVCLLRARRFA